MNNYHIGEEINKEMRRQGMKPADLAQALNRERQTVYDIFKKRHIATDTLANICRVLNRDFFSELSKANFDEHNNYEENEDELKEVVSGLMPENELHIFRTNYMFREVVDEYLLSERRKPLVIGCPAQDIADNNTSLPQDIERHALKLQGLKYKKHQFAAVSHGEHLEISSAVPHLTVLILKDHSYNKALAQAELLMEKTGNHVLLFIPVINGLLSGDVGGVLYEDIAEELFEAWKGRVHFAVAGSIVYHIRREYFHAYRRKGIIDNIIEKLNNGEDVTQHLFNLIYGYRILKAEEIKEEDATGLSRIRLLYAGSNLMDTGMTKLMFENNVNNNPRLDMWIDVRNGYIVDFQYNKRTQS